MKKNFICWMDDVKEGKSHFLNSNNKVLLNRPHHFSVSINCAYAVFDYQLFAWIPPKENIFSDSFEFLSLDPIKFDNFGMKKVLKIISNSQICHIITEEGSVYSWGNDAKQSGILALGETYYQPCPILNDNFRGKKMVDMSISESHGAAIDMCHQVYTWGSGSSGQLGLGDTVKTAVPLAVMKGDMMASTIKCGPTYTVLLDFKHKSHYFGRIYKQQTTSTRTFNETIEEKQLECLSHIENVFCGETMIALVDFNGRLYLYSEDEGLNRVVLDRKVKNVKLIRSNIYALTKESDYLYLLSSRTEENLLSEYIENLYAVDLEYARMSLIDTPYYAEALFFELECTMKSKESLERRAAIFSPVKVLPFGSMATHSIDYNENAVYKRTPVRNFDSSNAFRRSQGSISSALDGSTSLSRSTRGCLGKKRIELERIGRACNNEREAIKQPLKQSYQFERFNISIESHQRKRNASQEIIESDKSLENCLFPKEEDTLNEYTRINKVKPRNKRQLQKEYNNAKTLNDSDKPITVSFGVVTRGTEHRNKRTRTEVKKTLSLNEDLSELLKNSQPAVVRSKKSQFSDDAPNDRLKGSRVTQRSQMNQICLLNSKPKEEKLLIDEEKTKRKSIEHQMVSPLVSPISKEKEDDFRSNQAETLMLFDSQASLKQLNSFLNRHLVINNDNDNEKLPMQSKTTQRRTNQENIALNKDTHSPEVLSKRQSENKKKSSLKSDLYQNLLSNQSRLNKQQTGRAEEEAHQTEKPSSFLFKLKRNTDDSFIPKKEAETQLKITTDDIATFNQFKPSEDASSMKLNERNRNRNATLDLSTILPKSYSMISLNQNNTPLKKAQEDIDKESRPKLVKASKQTPTATKTLKPYNTSLYQMEKPSQVNSSSALSLKLLDKVNRQHSSILKQKESFRTQRNNSTTIAGNTSDGTTLLHDHDTKDRSKPTISHRNSSSQHLSIDTHDKKPKLLQLPTPLHSTYAKPKALAQFKHKLIGYYGDSHSAVINHFLSPSNKDDNGVLSKESTQSDFINPTESAISLGEEVRSYIMSSLHSAKLDQVKGRIESIVTELSKAAMGSDGRHTESSVYDPIELDRSQSTCSIDKSKQRLTELDHGKTFEQHLMRYLTDKNAILK